MKSMKTINHNFELNEDGLVLWKFWKTPAGGKEGKAISVKWNNVRYCLKSLGDALREQDASLLQPMNVGEALAPPREAVERKRDLKAAKHLRSLLPEIQSKAHLRAICTVLEILEDRELNA